MLRDWSLIKGRGGGYKTGGGHVKFCPYEKGGGPKVLPCLEGGGAQKFRDPRFSHFVAPPPPPPPLPVINDQSLTVISRLCAKNQKRNTRLKNGKKVAVT